ncbi:MAG: HNH endonuclease [bacterium]|nr:HNH endonuclease [bacterium]
MADRVKKPCIYCGHEADGAKTEYHIIPYSAGNIAEARYPLEELTLPTGLVCDKCNQYFGSKVEPHLTAHPVVKLWRVLKDVRGRAKTLEYTSEGLKLSSRKHKILVVEQGQKEKFPIDRSGVIKIRNPPLDKVNHTGVSRALHKIAFEYEVRIILNEMVKNEVDVARVRIKDISSTIIETTRKIILGSDYDHIRSYVRKPKRGEYRPYGMARDGGTWANVNTIQFKSSNDPAIVGPTFNCYIITLAGVRFIVTTAHDPILLSYALQQIEKEGYKNYLGVDEIFWNATGFRSIL